jgi:hypothetical protein
MRPVHFRLPTGAGGRAETRRRNSGSAELVLDRAEGSPVCTCSDDYTGYDQLYWAGIVQEDRPGDR